MSIDKPQYIQTAERMLGVKTLSPTLYRMLELANSRVAKAGGDGPVYGRELRSTQVIAGIITAWETLPPKVRNR